jgi:predicted transcriptional regulator
MERGGSMAKTVTVRLDDRAYELIRRAADGERRSVSNFLEYAALRYLTDDLSVSDEKLVASIRRGLSDAEAGQYRLVE